MKKQDKKKEKDMKTESQKHKKGDREKRNRENAETAETQKKNCEKRNREKRNRENAEETETQKNTEKTQKKNREKRNRENAETAETQKNTEKTQKQKKENVTISKKEYEELKEQEKKAEEYHDRMLRLSADYENARKRLDKEKEGHINFANESLVSKLLPIIDDFERAIQSADNGDDLNHVVTGVKLIKNQIYSLLKNNGLEKIEPENEKFNPNLHEAIGHVETDEHPEDNVVEVLQTGYLFKDRLLRPAVVKIAKRTEDRSQKTEDR